MTAYRETARWGVWDDFADLLPSSYARAISAAGGAAMLLPPGSDEQIAPVLDGIHGLILAGGPDVDPARYGADRQSETGEPRTERDSWELALALAALDRDLPLLAICRGMQILNVALGGTLIQHLPDVVGHDEHRAEIAVHGHHEVRLEPDGRLGALLGSELEVATYHHQALDRLGAGLVATGWAHDKIIEAVEHPASTWAFGVQWHPEVFNGEALFGAFIHAGKAYRDR
ncbi:MAG: peptidase [Frankiales bacterium]|nr:peptidase [Frankiales bacterium]